MRPATQIQKTEIAATFQACRSWLVVLHAGRTCCIRKVQGFAEDMQDVGMQRYMAGSIEEDCCHLVGFEGRVSAGSR